jgi:adenylate cyclase
MAREIAPRTREFASLNLLTAAQRAQLSGIASGLMITVAMLIIAVLAARALRDWREKRAGGVLALTYPGRVVRVPRGFSVLEASRENGIPHLSLCGGRARCSTCRVQVAGPAQNLPPAGEDERRTLARIGAGPDVRLACQLRPLGDIAVTPLLPAGALPALELEGLPSFERDVAILFIDLRRWTGLSEEHLPFDLVYVLNQYFTAVGDAVREAGGVPNQFIGDSVMAIFGLETAPDEACRQALAAAAGVERRMAELNERLRRDFGRALEFGMGIHAGRAAVGSVGYRDTRTLSAVGDAVNTASRLQELTKTYGVRLVISERVARAARLDTSGWQSHRISIRGRSAPLGIYAAGEATTPRAASS